MNALENLFGSTARVKLLKFFLLNRENPYEKAEIAKRAKITRTTATRELNTLEKIKFIKKKTFFKDGKVLKNGTVGKKKRVQGYSFNPEFPFTQQLYSLLINTTTMQQYGLARRINKTGSIKLIVTAGIFNQDDTSRVDILIVGDNIRPGVLKNTILTLESEIGKQLRYAAMTTADFKYRLSVCDRLVRDVFDYPHQKIVNKLGI